MDEHGHTFEKSAIEEWLQNHQDCPEHGPITQPPQPNLALKAMVDQILERTSNPSSSNSAGEYSG